MHKEEEETGRKERIMCMKKLEKEVKS